MKDTLPEYIESRFRKFARMGWKGVLLLVMGLVIAAYLLVTSPPVMEKIIVSQFSKFTTGTISLKVKKASLFRGFIFEDIEIKSGANFDRRTLLKLDQLKVLYSLFGAFVGDIGIHELGIYQPRLHLYQKKGIWNVQALLKPAKEKVIEEVEEEAETQIEEKNEISLPVSVRFFIKLVLENFEVTVDGDNREGEKMRAGVEHFSLKTHILTKKFDTIPLDVSASEIFDTFQVNLDPQKEIDFYFVNPSAGAGGPMELHWLLSYDGEQEEPGFLSRLEVGHRNIPVTYRGKHNLPLNFALDYNMNYNPRANQLNLHYMKIDFMGDTWLNLVGKIEHPEDADKMNLKISLNQSKIRLDKLYELYYTFTEDQDLTFSGDISLAPLYIDGPLNDLNIDGQLHFDRVKIKQKRKLYDFPYFYLTYSALLNKDLSGMPLVRSLVSWKGSFNGAKLNANAVYRPGEEMKLITTVTRFNPAIFSDEMVDGNFDMKFTLAGKSEKRLHSTLDVSSEKFFYTLDQDRSGENRLNLKVRTNISSDSSYENVTVKIPVFDLYLRNKQRRDAVRMKIDTTVVKTPKEITTDIDLKELAMNPRQLHSTLTFALKDLVDEYAPKMKKDVKVTGKTKVVMAPDDFSFQSLTSNTQMFVDDYDIDDIVLDAKLDKNSKRIHIDHIMLDGLNKALDLDIKGNVYDEMRFVEDPEQSRRKIKKLVKVPDVDIDFKFGKEERDRIFQNHTVQGDIVLDMSIKDNIIDGKFNIDKFYYDSGNFYRVNNANMDFAFTHDRTLKKAIDLDAANKERLINQFNKKFATNFSIDSIEIPSPTNKREPQKLIYPGGEFPGIHAAMTYKDNVFYMPILEAHMLDGLVTVQNTMFNVGRGDLSEMEYTTLVQAKELDFKKLIPAERAKTIDEGAISFDMMLQGRNLKKPLENANGYLSIYRIGEEFGRLALRVVKPDTPDFIDSTVQDLIIVEKIDIDFKEGLLYSQVSTTSGLISVNDVRQERITITDFLQRAENEIKVYQVTKETGKEANPEE